MENGIFHPFVGVERRKSAGASPTKRIEATLTLAVGEAKKANGRRSKYLLCRQLHNEQVYLPTIFVNDSLTVASFCDNITIFSLHHKKVHEIHYYLAIIGVPPTKFFYSIITQTETSIKAELAFGEDAKRSRGRNTASK